MVLEIIPYSTEWEEKWNRFVLNDSVNGTFLQIRNFLNYHPEGKFEDTSLIVVNKSNIVAVIPACVSEEAEGKCFYSHKGSTFGGIILDKQKYKISTMEELYPCLERYLREKKFYSIYIKNTSDIFSKERNDLFDYYFYKNDYDTINEVSFYINCEGINEKDITSTWSSGRRRDYRYSLNSELNFRHIEDDAELNSFYMILEKNLLRHDAKPVHTLEELIELDVLYARFSNQRIFSGIRCIGRWNPLDS